MELPNYPGVNGDEIYQVEILRDASEELSNTATSSTTDNFVEEVCDEFLNEKISLKRARKSAELAKKKIKKEKNEHLSNNDLIAEPISRECSCEKNDCQLKAQCAVNISQNCSNGSKVTYFHISKYEHVCLQCYEEFKSGRSMFDRYVDWKKQWIQESRCVPFLLMFIYEQFLPYWLNCSECGKLRRISRSAESELSSQIVSKFKCAHAYSSEIDDPCSIPEELQVIEVRNEPSLFIKTLETPPLLQHSPAVYFLEDHYYYDEVGLSPIITHFEAGGCLTSEFMCPFNIPNEQSKAFSLRPDVMEYDEIHAFPELVNEPMLYLAMRNLVLALWNLNPFEYLDYEKCFSHLICPGLARIWYSYELCKVIDYLALKNVINYGILPIPRDTLLSRKKAPRLEVVIVGGGISGIGAARQLQSLGAKVVLLEAKTKLGGRMQDDWSLGVAVGCGAQLVTGIMNNPLVLMCEQIELPYRLLSDECPLIDAQTGRLVTSMADRVVDEHFNCLLDIVGHWKNDDGAMDVSLLSQFNELHAKLLKHVEFHWAKEFERLLQWQIGNVEFSCGALLSDVSAKHWDQNENVGQFAGSHALLSHGTGELVKHLAQGIDIRCGHQVTEIDYTNSNKLIVKCENGKKFTSDKVLLCLPLTQYQKEQIIFTPELPSRKRVAYHSLGSGLIEKVAVRFPRRFWSGILKSDGTIDYFGHVPKCGEKRGLFNMFYDFSTRGTPKKQQHFVLMSYVCGESVNLVNTKTDVEIVNQFVDILQELFPNESIPAPIGYVVTHWGRDPFIGMSYSFIKVGGTGADYDEMASTVDNKLYFAGECTNRFYPQTMTGAYVSAMRESSKMVEDWLNTKCDLSIPESK